METEWNTADQWEQTTLGEICDMRGGVVFPRVRQGKRSGEYPFIKVSDMNLPENSICIWGANNYVDEGDLSQLKVTPFPTGTTVFAKIGEGLKQNRLRFLVGPTIIDNNMMGAMPITERVDPRFFFYALSQFDFGQLAEGTALPYLTVKDLSNLSLHLPPLPTQRTIAHILSTFDDKIELNQQMNETLEAIARAIFKSWFVNFDPVQVKMEGRKPDCMDSETAALFPSAFQDSALGQIPKGWEVDQVKNRASRIQYGFTQSASEKPVGPKFLRITDIASRKLNWASVPFCHITEKDHDKYKLQEGDILVARTGATTGANIYIVDPPDAVFASYLVRIQFHDLSIGRVVGEFMSSQAYDNYVASCIGGSAQPNANAQLLSAVEFVFPPPEIAKRFYEKVHALDKRRVANDRQSVTLSQIRDTLLPKLLSGEIRVV